MIQDHTTLVATEDNPPPRLERLYELSPTATQASRDLIRALYTHPSAPSWNHAAGDRLQPDDVIALQTFTASLATQRGQRNPRPSSDTLAWVERRIDATPLFRARVPQGLKPEHDWDALPTSSREDIARNAEYLVPDDVDLQRLIVYRTAGTTGHALLVPHDPLAVACYQPLLSFALQRYGVDTHFTHDDVACFLVGSQRKTVTYPTAVAGWQGAGFCKLNLFAEEWPSTAARCRYFEHFAPRFLTGDPLSFADLIDAEIDYAPKAMITTAVALSQGLKSRLEAAYSCPVIDWYSLTETGPLGYACPHGHGYHLLPHDVFIETLDVDGQPTQGIGEITVTGGRNPFLPLLRYRTGDWGRIDYAPCTCGDAMPRFVELEGRAPVRFRTATNTWINSQDIATVLRRYPLVQHTFEQDSSGACTLSYRELSNVDWPRDALEEELKALLGTAIQLNVFEDPMLGRRAGSDKVMPFRSCWLEE